MIDLQKLVDTMNANEQRVRSNYQLTLGQMIKALETADSALPVFVEWSDFVPRSPISYRGYYCDLAFRQDHGPLTAGELLEECALARGHTFEGYKGGDFVMSDDTPVWFSDYGVSSGLAFMSVEVREDAVVLTTRQIEA